MTAPAEPSPASAARNNPPLPVNDLARSYQPRRVWAAGISIAWNLLIASLFVATGAAERLYKHFVPLDPSYFPAAFSWVAPTYFSIFFVGYALLNFPLELWFGYLEERQFGLAKEGIRAWARDWLIGTIQHGAMFLIGACILLIFQVLAPAAWLVLTAASLLILFLVTTYLAADLIPLGLFHLQPADDATVARLTRLAAREGEAPPEPPSSLTREGEAQSEPRFPTETPLPPIIVYSHPGLREFAGGIVGLGNRCVFLISRSTLELASDRLLRFVFLHDLGHRRYHHNLLSALAGWAWVIIGVALSDQVIPARWGYNTAVFASPLYIAFLALTLSAWMAIGEPVLAYLGRRLEYQADRFYLRHGGSLDEMRAALDDLARQNLARTEQMRRRETIFHPLPSITNRLHAAGEYQAKRKA
jgi:Zn-dependent protease with chaperone function